MTLFCQEPFSDWPLLFGFWNRCWKNLQIWLMTIATPRNTILGVKQEPYNTKLIDVNKRPPCSIDFAITSNIPSSNLDNRLEHPQYIYISVYVYIYISYSVWKQKTNWQTLSCNTSQLKPPSKARHPGFARLKRIGGCVEQLARPNLGRWHQPTDQPRRGG